MSATNSHSNVDANAAGFPPAPSEAHQRAGAKPNDMTVSVLVGADAAYACIRTPGRTLDVRLGVRGRSAIKDMRLAAAELRKKAQREIERADLIERAALVLERDPAKGMFRAG